MSSMRVRIVADSLSKTRNRLTTFQLRFPTQILKEVNTHLILSKSASSSRAIPVEAKLEMLIKSPYRPLEVGKNRRGMQSIDPLEESQRLEFERLWQNQFEMTVGTVKSLQALGAHKQEINPLLEPFDWTTQVLTGTEWANFFTLRTHEAAKPAFRTLARAMYLAFNASAPVGEKTLTHIRSLHLPFVRYEDCLRVTEIMKNPMATENVEDHRLCQRVLDYLDNEVKEFYREGLWTVGIPKLNKIMLVVSAARCARVSYNRIGTRSASSLADDFDTFQKLMTSPMHGSPMQHQAIAMGDQKLYANYYGWLPFRKMLARENNTTFEPSREEVLKWEDEIDPVIYQNDDNDWL